MPATTVRPDLRRPRRGRLLQHAFDTVPHRDPYDERVLGTVRTSETVGSVALTDANSPSARAPGRRRANPTRRATRRRGRVEPPARHRRSRDRRPAARRRRARTARLADHAVRDRALRAARSAAQRNSWPTSATTPRASRPSSIASASAASSANGFSQMTWRPASARLDRQRGVRVGRGRDRHRVDARQRQRLTERRTRVRDLEPARAPRGALLVAGRPARARRSRPRAARARASARRSRCRRLRHRALVALVVVDDVRSGSFPQETAEVLDEDLDGRALHLRRVPGDVRAQPHLRMRVQPVPGRQRLGVDGVERRASRRGRRRARRAARPDRRARRARCSRGARRASSS